MKKAHQNQSGFTLIELLTVIAIIGILAAIIIPTVGAVKISANKAKTKVQFSQWASGMNLFKQEYGYYPVIGASNKVDSEKLSGALTARNLAGTKYVTTTDANLCGNKRLLSFYSVADSELNDTKTKLIDAFGNTDIVYFVDTNGDGMVSNADTPALSLQSVVSIDSVTLTPPNTAFTPATGIRSGVIFYSAGKGSVATDIVYSW